MPGSIDVAIAKFSARTKLRSAAPWWPPVTAAPLDLRAWRNAAGSGWWSGRVWALQKPHRGIGVEAHWTGIYAPEIVQTAQWRDGQPPPLRSTPRAAVPSKQFH